MDNDEFIYQVKKKKKNKFLPNFFNKQKTKKKMKIIEKNESSIQSLLQSAKELLKSDTKEEEEDSFEENEDSNEVKFLIDPLFKNPLIKAANFKKLIYLCTEPSNYGIIFFFFFFV